MTTFSTGVLDIKSEGKTQRCRMGSVQQKRCNQKVGIPGESHF